MTTSQARKPQHNYHTGNRGLLLLIAASRSAQEEPKRCRWQQRDRICSEATTGAKHVSSSSIARVKIALLVMIVGRQQVWSEHGAQVRGRKSPSAIEVRPDDICGALDQSGCSTEILNFVDRCSEETPHRQ